MSPSLGTQYGLYIDDQTNARAVAIKVAGNDDTTTGAEDWLWMGFIRPRAKYSS